MIVTCLRCKAPNDAFAGSCSQCSAQLPPPPPYNPPLPPIPPAPMYGAPPPPRPIDSPPPIAPPPPTVIIELTQRGQQPKRYSFYKNDITIGQTPGNDLILQEASIDNRHARLVIKDDKFIIVDLKSTSGTFVNGRKLTSPLIIKPEDKIYVGNFMLQLVTEHAGLPPAPPPGRIILQQPLSHLFGHEVFVGQAFGFVRATLATRPELSWLPVLYGESATESKVIPLLRETALPGLLASGDFDFIRGNALPSSDTIASINGYLLQGDQLQESPFVLERLSVNRARVTPTTSIETFCVGVLGAGASRQAAPLSNDPPKDDRLYQTAQKFFGQGQLSMAKALWEEARSSLVRPHPAYAYRIACCAARAGERDSAAQWIQMAINDGWSDLPGLREDPEFASLREHPVWQGVSTSEARHIFYNHTGEIPIFSSALIIVGAFIGGVPWEGWVLL